LDERREIEIDGDATYLSNDSDRQAGDRSEDDVNHESKITFITISPDGRYVAAGSRDGLIQLWDLQQISSSAGERQPPVLIERWRGHKDPVWGLSFAKNGQFLVSGSNIGDLWVWDVTHLGIAPAPGSLSSSSSLSKGAGNRDLVNDRPVTDGKGKQKGRCTMRLVGHWYSVESTAVSADGRWVVSGSNDGGVMWWDMGPSSAEDTSSAHGDVTKEAVCRLEGHSSPVHSVDLSPVGNMLATGGLDGLVRICELFLNCLDEFID
jgi:WD40 repeat protein